MLRDAAVALAVILGAYGLGSYGFPPGYLLIVSFDLFQNPLWPELGGTAFDAAILAYFGVLAVVAVGVASVARGRRGEPSRRWWLDGVGGALVVLGLLAFGFVLVVLPDGNPGPVFVGGVTAAVLLAAGMLVLRG